MSTEQHQQHFGKDARSRIVVAMMLFLICNWRNGRFIVAAEPSMRSIRVEVLETSILHAKSELSAIENRIRPLQEKYSALEKQVLALRPASEQKSSKAHTTPQEVEYRPPLLRASSKPSSRAIVCQDNRIASVDFKTLDLSIDRRRLIDARDEFEKTGRPSDILFSAPRGHFDLKVVFRRVTNGILPTRHLHRKTPDSGESIEELSNPGSEFMSLINQSTPVDTVFQFAVYHDSFDAFLAARAIVLEKGFDFFWLPYARQEPISYGQGGGNLSLSSP